MFIIGIGSVCAFWYFGLLGIAQAGWCSLLGLGSFLHSGICLAPVAGALRARLWVVGCGLWGKRGPQSRWCPLWDWVCLHWCPNSPPAPRGCVDIAGLLGSFSEIHESGWFCCPTCGTPLRHPAGPQAQSHGRAAVFWGEGGVRAIAFGGHHDSTLQRASADLVGWIV